MGVVIDGVAALSLIALSSAIVESLPDGKWRDGILSLAALSAAAVMLSMIMRIALP